jgi:hypothetical protein
MKHNYLVFDNVFDENELEGYQNKILNLTENIPLSWFSYYDDHEYKNFCLRLTSLAATFFDLSDSVGYEFWTQHNSRPESKHRDKDETLWNKNGELKYPICSIVFYLHTKKMIGGKLHFEDGSIIVPKSNRVVIFSPGIVHHVEEFEGERTSMLVNPWNSKPLGY